jgi:hypothetical protein
MMMFPIAVSLVLASSSVSLQFDGSLKDALKQIAKQGNLNVVVAGDLNEPVQVNLSDISADEALQTVSKIYGLELTHEGKLWVVRGHAAPPQVATTLTVPPTPPLPKLPAVPAVPSVVPDSNDGDDDEDAAQQARDAAERARDEAEAVREKAQELAEAQRDQAEAVRDMVRAHAELNRNLVSTGGPVTVEKGSKVDQAVAFGGPVTIEEDAKVEGDVVAFGGDVIIKDNAVVDGNATSFGGRVVRAPSAVVHGEMLSVGGVGLGTAISKGIVQTRRIEKHDEATAETDGAGKRLAVFLLEFSMFFGLGFVLMLLAPARMKAIEAAIRAEAPRNAAAGAIASPLLTFSCVGIPFLLASWVVGMAAVANTIGAAIPTGRLRKTQALALALGLTVMLLLWQVPVLNVIAAIGLGVVAVGAVLRTRFGQPTQGTPVLDSYPQPASV